MNPVESMEQYKELKASAKKRCPGLVSNCFLSGSGVKGIFERQGLLYEEVPQGLILYTDEGPFYRVFYYLDPNQDLPDMHQDKPVIIEEPDSNGRREEYLTAFFEKLENNGWERVARNIQVFGSLTEHADQIRAEYQAAIENLNSQGLKIIDCPPRHAQRVLAMWEESLQITDVPKEHKEFMNDPDQHVICVVTEDDFVCGVLWWRLRSGTCEYRHVVTDAGYYRRGIGSTLILHTMVEVLNRNCRGLSGPIDDRNYRSIAMCKKVGVVENGRTMVQYSLTKGE